MSTLEQQDLRQTVASYFADRYPLRATRDLIDSGTALDRDAWVRLASELGVQGLGIPEAYGGLGYGLAEQAVVFEEAGAALVPAPLLGTVALAATAVLAADDAGAAKELLPGLADGSVTAALAMTEDDGGWDVEGTALRAERRPHGGVALTGHKNYVVDGACADLLLVVGRGDAGLGLYAVDPHGDGVTRSALATLDLTRGQARFTFSGAAGRLVGVAGAGVATIAATMDVAATLLACEQVGVARRCLETAVEYAGMRVQFGRPIGSFQAVKHRCANMLIAVESARSAAYAAVESATAAPSEFPVAAAMAKVVASEAAVSCAAAAIQIHGGIGFTWEHDAHLYYRRAHADALLFGDVSEHRERIARLLAI